MTLFHDINPHYYIVAHLIYMFVLKRSQLIEAELFGLRVKYSLL